MNVCRRFNSGWLFLKQILSEKTQSEKFPDLSDEHFINVNLPHDWMIYNSADHYENSQGWYKKELYLENVEKDVDYLLYFEGVYMDCTIYVNKNKAGEWKYGYSSFEIRLTPFLKSGKNEILVQVRYFKPNSRWYSGAGIYRNVWLKKVPCVHIASDGICVQTWKEDKKWHICMHTTMQKENEEFSAKKLEDMDKGYHLSFALCELDGTVLKDDIGENTSVELDNIKEWNLENPYLYKIRCTLYKGDTQIQIENVKTGFRELHFDPNEGFFLNGVHKKLNGVCQHHDLGALGAAVNRSAIKRQLNILKGMGVNAIRTTHNMPAVELLELTDEMGFLVVDEAFDMWERSKTTYDYARFFKEWSARDVKSWVCRDRNHPSVIMWSTGNEIYDTHCNKHGQEITAYLIEQIKQYDPWGHALATIGSSFMEWGHAQRCAELLKVIGYNYAERLYDEHHETHPDWIIYGSETSSTVQSRGIYHFPHGTQILSDEDGQCSSLGNSTVNWGAKSQEFCAMTEMNKKFSMGQFLWSGFDYIGEPTPYQSRNSFFGQIDTAGFAKDSYYFYQSVWTDFKANPMIHLLPYWNFNPGQLIDVRVYTNAPEAALFLNGKEIGKKKLTREDEAHLTADWKIPYEAGTITAIAYDEDGNEIACDEKRTFNDTAALKVSADRLSVNADGKELVFVSVEAIDEDGNAVANANNRIHIKVEGEGILAGVDNGDSTDYEPYKGDCRRLFSGKMLAIIAPTLTPGEIKVTAYAKGILPSSVTITTKPCSLDEDDCIMTVIRDPLADEISKKNEIPVRSIILTADRNKLSKEEPSTLIHASVYPHNAYKQPLEWRVTDEYGNEADNAIIEKIDEYSVSIKTLYDGEFYVRCSVKNGREHTNVYSLLDFAAEGIAKPKLRPEKIKRTWEELFACYADRIYGDSFSREGETITEIGNNVAIEFDNMDFENEKKVWIEILGHSPIENNTIHVRMKNKEKEILNIAEFSYSDDYTLKRFPVSVLPGSQKVTLLFLPGSRFDIKTIKFVKEG